MQIRNSPEFFVARARALTHSVGSFAGAITTFSVSRSSSSFKRGLSVKGIFRAGVITGLTVASTFSVYDMYPPFVLACDGEMVTPVTLAAKFTPRRAILLSHFVRFPAKSTFDLFTLLTSHLPFRRV